MALKDHVVWNHQLVKLGTVKAADTDDAIARAKVQFPYCVAPIVQNAVEAEKPQVQRYMQNFGAKFSGVDWSSDRFKF